MIHGHPLSFYPTPPKGEAGFLLPKNKGSWNQEITPTAASR